MADEDQIDETGEDTPPRKRKRRWAKRAGWLLALIIAPIILAIALLNTSIGKRFIAEQIAAIAPASGLRFEVGRIEGDIFSDAVLHDVVLLDPKGEFLTIPRVELEWRPLAWLTRGLDVSNLTAERGNLTRLPELEPGDPDAPILPDFDIRIGRLALEDFTIAPGIAGDEAQVVNLEARADIRSGRVFAKVDGAIGAQDRLALLLDARPDGDRFDMSLDYRAPLGGAMAQMLDADAGYRARIEGDGTWSNWLGHALVTRNGERFAALRVTNRAGEYGILGKLAPAAALEGLPARAAGNSVAVVANGTLLDSTLDGNARLIGAALDARGEGAIDLADNAFEDFALDARLTDPTLFGEDLALEDTRLQAVLDGPFRDLRIGHELEVGELISGETRLVGISQSGTARFDGASWTLPLDADIERVVSGNEWVDPRLVDGTLDGTLSYSGVRLTSDDLRIVFPGLGARLSLRGNTATGAYALAGPVSASGVELDGIGRANADAKIVFQTASGAPWSLRANLAGRITQVTNETIANLAGPQIRFRGGVGIGGAAPLTFREVELEAEKLTLALDGQIEEGRTTIAGSGRHTEYGPFTVEAAIADDGPQAVLVFADPLPAAGLENVRVALSPTDNGFAIETEGGSLLGPFAGELGLVSPADGPTVVDISSLRISQTDVTGRVSLVEGGAQGNLQLAGGGLDGTIALAPSGGGQGFDLDLTARNARFGGDTPISLNRAQVDVSGRFADGSSRIEGTINGQGIGYGNLFIGQLSARAQVVDGRGDVTARIAGRRGSRFNLALDGDIAPERIAVIARGSFAGQDITMPRRAVLTSQPDGGWQLSRTQFGYGDGRALVSGSFGGGDTALDLSLVRMPLSLVDVVAADFGLGGTISGKVDFRSQQGTAPSGTARVKLDGLTRSGLVLTSRPLDVSLVARLSPNRLDARAVLDENGTRLGRVQARITDLPGQGGLVERLQRGSLLAQMRYRGAADALWRLAAIDAFDITGPVSVAANATGSLLDPRVRGSLSSDDLRVQSAISGTNVRDVSVRGSFAGSRLRLQRFEGRTSGEGRVTGSGSIDLADIGGGRGPRIDLRVAADNARLLNANGLSATLTGPLRIVSDGIGGTIAGRVRIDEASWRLGTTADEYQLPDIDTREINQPPDVSAPTRLGSPWRYLVDARAPSRINVDGMGLDSEWGADIILRGTTDDPRIGGEARVVRGAYSFAGTRFELTRGRIDFDENVPIDPQIDILAETQKDGLSVTVSVSGNAQQPQITFQSDPALPEEEILSRLLFGDSITSLSATDALQLGTALASLRGGSGMDPINQLRSAIGLDRLRIVGADPALGRGTGVALGKNIGSRFYVEIVTDGRGYSATEVEFRITSWLALLGTVSTIGRQSAVVEVSRDY